MTYYVINYNKALVVGPGVCSQVSVEQHDYECVLILVLQICVSWKRPLSLSKT